MRVLGVVHDNQVPGRLSRRGLETGAAAGRFAGAAAAGAAGTDGLSGRYLADEEPGLSLTLNESPDGGVTGTLEDPGTSMPLSARRQGATTPAAGATAGKRNVVINGQRLSD
jgi:hypothetical protein